jgi:sugar lactone lactonase YvrE
MGWVAVGRRVRVVVAASAIFFFSTLRAQALDAGGIIDTLAGGGLGDGFPSEIASVDPDTVSIGPDGAIYIAESSRNRIRRIDPQSGFIETLAGIGSEGFAGDGGPAVAARLRFPTSAAADAAGNVYIADQSNHRIRRVAPNGIITTVAGSGTAGYLDGAAGSAKLYFPRTVSVDPSGNVLIAEPFNQRIRYLNVGAGTVSTVAGTGVGGFSGDGGAATQAKLQLPSGVFSLSNGTFLIADQGNHRIRKVEGGNIRTVAGSASSGFGGDNGQATSAKLSFPVAVSARADGAFIIADQNNHRVRLVSASGTITTVAGTGTGGFNGDSIAGSQAWLNRPAGVAFMASGDCLIADLDNERVRLLDRCAGNGAITTLAGVSDAFRGDGYPALASVFKGPADAIEDVAGNIYIADSGDNRIRRITTNGIIETIAGTGQAGFAGDGGPATQAQLRQPNRLAFDAQGQLLVLDTNNRRVRRINLSDGRITTIAGNGDWGSGGDDGPAQNASFMFPLGLAVDSGGRIYVADASARRIRMIGQNGVISTVAGTGVATGSIDGPGGNPADNLGDNAAASSATFIAPSDVAADGTGNIYVTDMTAHRVRKIDTNGIIRPLAGTGVGTGRIDGPGGDPDDNLGDGGPATLSSVNTPVGIDVAANGDVFIADQANRRMRLVRNGIISTIGGNGVVTWSVDGESGNPTDDLGDGEAVAGATFMALTSIFVDTQGNALVTDSQSTRVRAIAGGGGPPPSPTPSYTRTPTWTPVVPAATATRTSTPIPTNTPSAASVAISGRITYYNNPQVSVAGVDVSLAGAASLTVKTTSSGSYGSSNLPAGTWVVEPSKQGSIGTAVSSLDAARVLQVIAGMKTFNSLQRLACDVTGDGTLSALDAVRILQLSAGVIEQLPAAEPCRSDWLFYPSPAAMPNQETVLPSISGVCHPGSIVMDPLQTTATNQDFDAILLGDCTGNWTPSVGAALRLRSSSGPRAHSGTPRRVPGGRIRVPIYVQAGTPFQALDLTLSYEPTALSLVSVRLRAAAAGALTSVSNERPGQVSISLASARPIDSSAGVLTVEFAGDARAAHVRLLSAQIDEQPARVVTHGAD